MQKSCKSRVYNALLNHYLIKMLERVRAHLPLEKLSFAQGGDLSFTPKKQTIPNISQMNLPPYITIQVSAYHHVHLSLLGGVERLDLPHN